MPRAPAWRIPCARLLDEGRRLGLTFCWLAIEAHGGTIRVEDNQPRGSRFHLRLPVTPPRT